MKNHEKNLSQETFANDIHTEEYQNDTLFNLRGQRLEELGYTKVITITSSATGNPPETEKRMEDAISLLNRYKREIAILQYGTTTEIYQRAPGTYLPTAKEDYESPAGKDTLIAFAVSQTRTNVKEELN